MKSASSWWVLLLSFFAVLAIGTSQMYFGNSIASSAESEPKLQLQRKPEQDQYYYLAEPIFASRNDPDEEEGEGEEEEEAAAESDMNSDHVNGDDYARDNVDNEDNLPQNMERYENSKNSEDFEDAEFSDDFYEHKRFQRHFWPKLQRKNQFPGLKVPGQCMKCCDDDNNDNNNNENRPVEPTNAPGYPPGYAPYNPGFPTLHPLHPFGLFNKRKHFTGPGGGFVDPSPWGIHNGWGGPVSHAGGWGAHHPHGKGLWQNNYGFWPNGGFGSGENIPSKKPTFELKPTTDAGNQKVPSAPTSVLPAPEPKPAPPVAPSVPQVIPQSVPEVNPQVIPQVNPQVIPQVVQPTSPPPAANSNNEDPPQYFESMAKTTDPVTAAGDKNKQPHILYQPIIYISPKIQAVAKNVGSSEETVGSAEEESPGIDEGQSEPETEPEVVPQQPKQLPVQEPSPASKPLQPLSPPSSANVLNPCHQGCTAPASALYSAPLYTHHVIAPYYSPPALTYPSGPNIARPQNAPLNYFAPSAPITSVPTLYNFIAPSEQTGFSNFYAFPSTAGDPRPPNVAMYSNQPAVHQQPAVPQQPAVHHQPPGSGLPTLTLANQPYHACPELFVDYSHQSNSQLVAGNYNKNNNIMGSQMIG